MADFGRSFIEMYGNQAVKDLTTEVNRRLYDSAIDESNAVGEVLFGFPCDEAEVGIYESGSDWVCRADHSEFGDFDQLCFKSSVDIPEKLENHIVWFYSKVDPDTVLCNQYDSEEGHFVGVRLKIVRNGKIFTFHHRKENYAIISDDLENNPDHISWSDLWKIQDDLYREARAELIEKFPTAESYIPTK